MGDKISMYGLRVAAEKMEKEATYLAKFHRIPHHLQIKLHPDSIVPQCVSIGPFHHVGHLEKVSGDMLNKLAMEGRKRVHVLKYLELFRSPEKKLEDCKRFLIEKAADIWRCYSDETDMSDELLGEIMLVDGCFILELLRGSGSSVDDNTAEMYCRELIMIENQIPFFVLEGFVDGLMPRRDLIESVLQFFQLTPELPPLPDSLVAQRFSHLLDVIGKCHQPTAQDIKTSFDVVINMKSCGALMSATKLEQAGLTFRSLKGAGLLDIKYYNGVLYMPPLVIHDFTETLIINLVAHEYMSMGAEKYLTSYIMLMGQLIRNREDFQLLEKKGIIINEFGGTDKAEVMFSIGKNMVVRKFVYKDLYQQIEAYVDSRKQRLLQDLKKRCFDSPLTTVSVIVATILLVLTFLQTLYGILSYYHPK